MTYFAERLKAARKMNGLSLQDLSDIISNKHNKQLIHRLESGTALPDSETLSLLTKALKVPADYFFKEASVVLENIKFRKLKKLPVKEQEKIAAQTTDLLERYIELEDILGLDNKIKFKPYSYKVETEEDAENAAKDLRKKWALGEDPLPNIVEMLEENNIKVCMFNVDKAFSGMSTVIQNKIGVIVLNNNPDIPVTRRRFTALHELSHLYLNLSAFDDKTCERICDRFAGAMLLPESKIKQYLGDKRSKVIMRELYIIAEQYGISLSAIMYRGLTLNIISASYHKFFMIKYNQYNTREQEFKIYNRKETSERFLYLLIRAVAEEVISSTKAAALNNQKLGDFREILDNAAK